jgi:hypothetical protein
MNGRGSQRRVRSSLAPRDSVVSMSMTSSASGALAEFAAAIRAKALRPAAHAGAEIMYREMRLRVPVDEGQLYSSIYQWHDDKRSDSNRQVYVVGPNKVKAPHWHLVEYGHWRVNKVVREGGRLIATKERLETPVWVPAKPYARPTYEARVQAAVQAMLKRLKDRVDDIKAGRP